ncbi:hypothetical protein HK098_000101 [Nowakowskiella sp. JEL0407]|nr:hypothetical protein HK098_000101 [Nowakowskiella sp. JEL0407]
MESETSDAASAHIEPLSASQTDTTPHPSETKPQKQKQKPKKLSSFQKTLLGIRKNVSPILPNNSLSVVEQFFYRFPPDSPQVIIGGAMRLSCPPSVTHISVRRLVDLMKETAAQHHRLSCSVQKDATTKPLAQTADQLKLNITVTTQTTHKKLKNILNENLNQNFDLNDTSKPLWRCVLLVPEDSFAEVEHEVTDDFVAIRDYFEEEDGKSGIDSFELSNLKPHNGKGIFWEFVLSFHHCLGDGLSVYTFSKTIFDTVTDDKLTASEYDISNIPVNQDPPPVLDNLMKPFFWQVVPVGFSVLSRYLRGYDSSRFKGSYVSTPEKTFDTSDSEQTISLTKPQTKALLFSYSEDFVGKLRDKCRSEKTNVTALMVAAGLAAVRSTFKDVETTAHHDIPSHHGFVLTTSFRHLIPGSKLVEGGDKQSDPAMQIFGGYGGAAMNASIKVEDSQDLFERARKIKKNIFASFRSSLSRAMLVNYTYRHEAMWRFITERNSLVQAKVQRNFSVELANLGVWNMHTASPDGPEDDPRLRLYNFWGTVNCSFQGARGLFTIGTVTLGKDMSLAIAYDTGAVSEADAERFVRTFDSILKKAISAEGKLTVMEAGKV